MIPIVILTSGEKRHRYFANTLAGSLDVRGIVMEEKRPRSRGQTQEEDRVIIEHFRQRSESEERFFGTEQNFAVDSREVLRIENGRSNDQEVFEWVRSHQPQYIVLFGTSIIKPPLLSHYDGHIINIHLGLSPYYRGSGTNFWPLVDNLPECVGATIHLAVLAVDAGPILTQVRPEVTVGDRNHDMGNKTITQGAKGMIHAIQLYSQGAASPVQQDISQGKVFRKKDFTAAAVLKMWKNLDEGMIDYYVLNKEKRDAQYPIVSI